VTIEFLEGDQLFTKIQNKHTFTADETKQIMKGLLKGLAHMNEKRIIHRDLKP
jgi:serine/threonine protein kinase